MREYWGQNYNPSVEQFLTWLDEEKVGENHPNLSVFLNNLDAVAIYWKEGIIFEDHVREFFWRDLKLALKKPAKDLLKAKSHRYPNLVDLLERSKKWKV